MLCFSHILMLSTILTILGILSVVNSNKSREQTTNENRGPLTFLRHATEQPIRSSQHLSKGDNLDESYIKSLDFNKTGTGGKMRDVVKSSHKSSGYNIRDICNRYDIDGCSIPFGLPFFYKQRFTTSCYRHDVCYRCGIDYDVDRKECDVEFRDLMRAACKRPYFGRDVEDNTPNTKLHKQRVLQSLDSLEGQFEYVLRREISAVLKSSGGTNDSTPQRFIAGTKSIQLDVLKIWARLLRQRLVYIQDTKSNSIWEVAKSNAILYTQVAFSNTKGETPDSKVSGKETLKFVKSREMEIQNFTGLDTTHPEGNGRIIRLEVKAKCQNFSNKDSSVHDLCEEVMWDLAKQEGVAESTLKLPDIGLLICRIFSSIYYWGVRLFGRSSYRQTSDFYCGQDWVRRCIPD